MCPALQLDFPWGTEEGVERMSSPGEKAEVMGQHWALAKCPRGPSGHSIQRGFVRGPASVSTQAAFVHGGGGGGRIPPSHLWSCLCLTPLYFLRGGGHWQDLMPRSLAACHPLPSALGTRPPTLEKGKKGQEEEASVDCPCRVSRPVGSQETLCPLSLCAHEQPKALAVQDEGGQVVHPLSQLPGWHLRNKGLHWSLQPRPRSHFLRKHRPPPPTQPACEGGRFPVWGPHGRFLCRPAQSPPPAPTPGCCFLASCLPPALL